MQRLQKRVPARGCYMYMIAPPKGTGFWSTDGNMKPGVEIGLPKLITLPHIHSVFHCVHERHTGWKVTPVF